MAEDNLPDKQCDIYTQAIMDVGALICKRANPECSECPLNDNCLASKNNQQKSLPNRSHKKVKPVKNVYWLILQNKAGEILLENRNTKAVWEGLWAFLEFGKADERQEYLDNLSRSYEVTGKDSKLKHTFTHYKLDINLLFIKIKGNVQNFDNNKIWFNREELKSVGLPSPVSKILKEMK